MPSPHSWEWRPAGRGLVYIHHDMIRFGQRVPPCKELPQGAPLPQGFIEVQLKGLRVPDPIYPFELVNLPNALARVQTPKDAVRFVEAYGLLGWHDLKYGSEGFRPLADPVWWFMAQAKAVRFALRLIEALQEPDESKLDRILDSERTELPTKKELFGFQIVGKETSRHKYELKPSNLLRKNFPVLSSALGLDEYPDAYLTVYQLPLGPERGLVPFVSEAKKPRLQLLIEEAVWVVATLVEGNTQGVKWELVPSETKGPPWFMHLPRARALIEAIWFHVGSMALQIGSDEKSDEIRPIRARRVRLCEECGTPFLVTDGRMRFCPPDPLSKESLCGARARWRRRAIKKKEANLDGESSQR